MAVGSRDRYLNVLNTDKLVSGEEDSIKSAQIFSKMEAHAVSISNIDKHIYLSVVTAAVETGGICHIYDVIARIKGLRYSE